MSRYNRRTDGVARDICAFPFAAPPPDQVILSPCMLPLSLSVFSLILCMPTCSHPPTLRSRRTGKKMSDRIFPASQYASGSTCVFTKNACTIPSSKALHHHSTASGSRQEHGLLCCILTLRGSHHCFNTVPCCQQRHRNSIAHTSWSLLSHMRRACSKVMHDTRDTPEKTTRKRVIEPTVWTSTERGLGCVPGSSRSAGRQQQKSKAEVNTTSEAAFVEHALCCLQVELLQSFDHNLFCTTHNTNHTAALTLPAALALDCSNSP